MKVAIGSDHAGFNMKQYLLKELTALGYEMIDCGTDSEVSVDYPDYAGKVCTHIKNNDAQFGILICSTGIGVSIAANKIRGIRAALCHDTFSARRAREHTDANILCMGEWAIGQGSAREIVKTYLTSEFVGGRHARRLEKMLVIEDQQNLA